MITTGAVPSTVTKPTVTINDAAAHAKGFIVTSSGIMGSGITILDSDGAVVWWGTGPNGTSRANMSWDGNYMYSMALNVMNTGGELRRMTMDGMTTQMNFANIKTAHHDLTAIPGGGIATMLWNSTGMDAHCSVVELSPDGTMTTVVPDLATIYAAPNDKFHSNSIHYYAADDSYTISDRNPNLYVKITRKGQLVWQFGGSSPKDQAKFFSGGSWTVNHGHHYLPDGTFLLFNNGAMVNGMSTALSYKLDTATMKATAGWNYVANGTNSMVLGDVQRLPNGNTLVTFSTSGAIHEVDGTGKVVMTIKQTAFGYSEWRETLYGPPGR
jgi:hypothetical protein